MQGLKQEIEFRGNQGYGGSDAEISSQTFDLPLFKKFIKNVTPSFVDHLTRINGCTFPSSSFTVFFIFFIGNILCKISCKN